MPRTGWVLMEIAKPETVAEHTFRVAFAGWLLAKKANLDIERVIKISLSHDLCEVYAGDRTPFFYYPNLPKEKEARKKALMKWARLSISEKEKIGGAKLEREKKSLLELLKPLEPRLKKEIFSFWVDYERGISREGRFVRQLNRVETLLQSIDYFGTKDIAERTNWWEWTEEIVDHPLFLELLETVQKIFYDETAKHGKNKLLEKIWFRKPKGKELENILDFIIKVGELKKISRKGWVLRGIENPETIANHIFILTLMCWIFGQKEKGVNLEKLLKMTLCYELPKILLGDTTPYDKILKNKEEKEKKGILKKWIRLSRKEKAVEFLKSYKKEKKALKKLISKLEDNLKKEILQLWEEFKLVSSPEGYFLSQIDVLATLFQALQYWQKDKHFPINAIWEWAFEASDTPMNFEFMEELKEKFYFK